MTSTAVRGTSHAPGMSEAGRNFDTEEEVNTMTATTVFHRQLAAPVLVGARRARPRGLDRLVMRLSLTMLLWARHHAERDVLSHEEHALRRAVALGIQEREREAALGVARVF
jgi:hypothetical protein